MNRTQFLQNPLVSRGLLVGASLLMTATTARSTESTPDGSLYQWRSSQKALRGAAELLGQRRFREAETELGRLGRVLPGPYNDRALDVRKKLRMAMAVLGDGVFEFPDPSKGMLYAVDPNEVNGGSHRYTSVGRICEELNAPYPAARLYWRAHIAKPHDSSAVQRLCRMLVASRSDEEVFRRVESTMRGDRSKQACRDALATLKKHLARTDESLLNTVRKGKSGLSLEEIHQLAPKAQNAEQKLAIYQVTIKSLDAYGDFRGRDAWEEKLLGEFIDDQNACAAVWFRRGDFHKVCNDYPSSRWYRRAIFEYGKILQSEQQYDDAVAEYRKLLSDGRDKLDLNGNIKRPDMRFSHSAAKQIACCYEAKGNLVKAIEWVEAARSRYPPRSFCGTCAPGYAATLVAWRKRLQDRARHPDSIREPVAP